ncbi:MAG TPA: sporulation protein YhbH [Candidatus Eisenbacteria bacterium]|nr:sporulation protein YhbH [Candidatus Eisenbacteria bacterium]
MSRTVDSIFRPYAPADAERSDRSAGDRARHRAKVRESIRENIADIIAEESIIGQSRDRVIKVPIRGIKEYRFVYGDNTPQVGQGKGSTERGQVVGKANGEADGEGQDKAGDRPGADYYETEVTLEELIEIMFEDLELPDLERKALRQLESIRFGKRKGYRQVGIRVRLDKRRTVRERSKRLHAARRRDRLAAESSPDPTATLTTPRRFPFHDHDLVYRHIMTDIRNESNAVVLCLMDTSGSMDTMKKYLARSFFFLLYQFICTKYQNVEISFIAHHTEAKEVTEEEFFHKGESGGTFISSAYLKALEIIKERYHPSLWNVYAFHCSDGDNFDSDNPAALKSAKELSEVCNLFGYGEIKPLGSRYYESSMLNVFRRLEADNFQTVLIERKEDIWPSFKAFLGKDRAAAEG